MEAENRILKECGCSYSASLQEMLFALEKLHGVVIGLFSRKVLAYRFSDVSDASFAIETMDAAFEEQGKPKGLLFHSNQGAQYVAYLFQEYLRQNGVRQSLSTPDCPYDNAVVESFICSLKCEEASRVRYKSIKEIGRRIDDYIAFYNNDRPHQSLGYRTPQQVEDAYKNQELVG